MLMDSMAADDFGSKRRVIATAVPAEPGPRAA